MASGAAAVMAAAVMALVGPGAGPASAAPAQTVTAPNPPASAASVPVTTRGDVVCARGLRVRIAPMPAGSKASVTVTGPAQPNSTKRYRVFLKHSRKLNVVAGVYKVVARNVSATGGTAVPNVPVTRVRVGRGCASKVTVVYGLRYSVVYNAGMATSGSVPVDPNLYLAGATVTVLGQGALARTSCFFFRWNTSSNFIGGTQYSPGNTLTMPAASVTLYAEFFCED